MGPLQWLINSIQEEDFQDKEMVEVMSILSQKLTNVGNINQLHSELCNKPSGSIKNNLVEIIQKIVLDNTPKVKISIISALRQIKNTEEINFSEFDGGGLIVELAKLQDPEFNKIKDNEKYVKIQGFLREITNSPKAKINIPYSREYIQVDIEGNGNYLPLDSLGTGIHEVLILAAACTILNDQIICIEEPELHLHPLLQRKFINYINAQTNNQYFISTHSAHFLDTPEVSIFHVQYENGSTVVHPAYKNSDKSFICDDLGYKYI